MNCPSQHQRLTCDNDECVSSVGWVMDGYVTEVRVVRPHMRDQPSRVDTILAQMGVGLAAVFERGLRKVGEHIPGDRITGPNGIRNMLVSFH